MEFPNGKPVTHSLSGIALFILAALYNFYAPRGDDAAIVRDALKHIMNVPPHNEVHHPIDDRERDRYDDEHRQRGQKYELSVQFLDHIHK